MGQLRFYEETGENGENSIIVLRDGINPDNKVQKSRPLYNFTLKSNLKLRDMKILDVYLSRINSYEENGRTIVFAKKDLDELFGREQKRKDIEESLVRLLTVPILFVDNDENIESENTKYKSVTLFEEAEIKTDKSDNKSKITLRCSEYASKYIFNIQNIGYFQYSVKMSAQITSIYTFNLFNFLQSKRLNGIKYPQTFDIMFEDLKKALKCTEKSYSLFREFNRSILQPAKEELNKLNYKFDYKPVKSRKDNRAVDKITFTIYDSNDENDAYSFSLNEPQLLAVQKINPVTKRPLYCYNNSYDEHIKKQEEMNRKEIFSLNKEKIIANLAAFCENEFSPKQMGRLNDIISEYLSEQGDKEKYLHKMYRKLGDYEDSEPEDRFNRLVELINDDDSLKNENYIYSYGEDEYSNEKISFLAEACNNEFSDKEMRVISDIITNLCESGIIENDDIKKFDYLSQCYNKLNLYANKKELDGKPIKNKNRYTYFRKMLENELKK